MKVTFYAPFQDDEIVRADNEASASLAILFKDFRDYVDRVVINGKAFPEWWLFVPGDNDVIEVFVLPGITVGTLVAYLVVMLLSIALQFIVQALTPGPKKPSNDRAQPGFGIAGITNTVAPGTVKFLVYGKRRVFGHLIASSTDLAEPRTNDLFRKMTFSVVYFMGAGPIKHIVEPKLGDGGTNYFDFPGTFAYDTRLGTEDQTIFPAHQNVHQTYTIGKTLPVPSQDDDNANTPIVETTRGIVDRVTLTFSFPNGIFSTVRSGSNIGDLNDGWYGIKVDWKRNDQTDWNIGVDPTVFYRTSTKDGLFAQHIMEFPERARYDIRVQCTNIRIASQQSGPPAWFNMKETQYITTAYPGSSLLEVSGIGSEQFSSIEALKISGLVCGRIIPWWDPTSQMIVRAWTNSRAWICRDVLLDQKHCLGSTFSEDMIDDGSLIRASTEYELDQVTGYSGLEDRDHCDVILGSRDGARPGWDVLKNLSFEGDTRWLPLRGKMTYVIDAGGDPVRDYSDPGNVLEGTVGSEFGRNDKAANTLFGAFANEADNYREMPTKLVRRAGIAGDYERSEDATYISITRESQVARRMRRDIEEIDLVDKFWNFQCERTALRSYPTQILRLSYRTILGRMGVSGFIAEGSTGTVIQLDRAITLEAGRTYTAYVLHKADDSLENRTVVTPAGRWGAIAVSSAFTNLVTGDIITIGVAAEQINNVKLLTIERGTDTIYSLKTAIYVPSVYEIDNPLPHVVDGVGDVTNTNQGPQQPIIAQVVGNVGAGRAEFKIAPGFNYYRGVSQNTTATYVDLALKEPAIDDFFNGYTIELNVGSGTILTITDYVGATRRATLSGNPGIGGPMTYRLTSPPASFFSGFSVERSASLSPTASWTFVSSTPTTKLNVPGLQASTDYFRILPISGQGNENLVGPWIIQLSTGDVTGPAAPTAVVITASGKDVSVQVTFNFPLGRDVYRINMEINEAGVNRNTQTFDISNQRNEDNTTGDNTVSMFYDASALPDGTILIARANIEDYFDNKSAWVESLTATLTPEEEDEQTAVTSSTYPGDVSVFNTVIETTVSAGTIAAGALGSSALARLTTFFRVTDNDAAHDGTITLRLKWKGVTLVTMTCRTSDEVSNLGTEFSWKVTGYMAMKGTADSALAVVEKIGLNNITDKPYPGMPAKIVRALNTGIDTATVGELSLTVQLSMASTGFGVVKEYSFLDFVVNG